MWNGRFCRAHSIGEAIALGSPWFVQSSASQFHLHARAAGFLRVVGDVEEFGVRGDLWHLTVRGPAASSERKKTEGYHFSLLTSLWGEKGDNFPRHSKGPFLAHILVPQPSATRHLRRYEV